MAAPPRPFLLLRHGETTWNAERRWQGWADAPLSPLGRRQAVEVAAHLRDHGFTVACASDLQRATHTATLLAGELGIAGGVVVDQQLRERHVGAFEGKTIEQLLVEFPDCFEEGTRRLLRVPGGETDDDLWIRVAPALVSVADRFRDETLLVVSHGGVIRTVERHLGLDPGASTPNLGGRWLSVVGGALVAGDRFVPAGPGRTTAPGTE